MPGFEVLYQAAALCLMYPDDDFRARLPLLREAAPQLREFADHAAVTPADGTGRALRRGVRGRARPQPVSERLARGRPRRPPRSCTARTAWRPPARSHRTSCPRYWSSRPAPATPACWRSTGTAWGSSGPAHRLRHAVRVRPGRGVRHAAGRGAPCVAGGRRRPGRGLRPPRPSGPARRPRSPRRPRPPRPAGVTWGSSVPAACWAAWAYIAWPIFWLTEASFSTPARRALVSAFCSSSSFSSSTADSTSVFVSAGTLSPFSRTKFSVW